MFYKSSKLEHLIFFRFDIYKYNFYFVSNQFEQFRSNLPDNNSNRDN